MVQLEAQQLDQVGQLLIVTPFLAQVVAGVLELLLMSLQLSWEEMELMSQIL
tara:strand:+ start:366 stop:521 length:156 start_codon:yes stop_codon:yes gene_type:complete